MIVDAHNHIGEITGVRQTVEELIQRMDSAGVDKCVAFAWPQWPDNAYVAEASERNPDRILPFACVNPWSPTACDQLQRLLDKDGFMGLKLHPYLHGYALDDLEIIGPLFDHCQESQVPVLAHGMADNPYTMPLQFEEVARAFPDVPLIMAHSGFMWGIGQALRVANRSPNIYLETSVTDATDVRAFVEEVGAERVIMGSDTPFAFHQAEIEKVERAVEDPAARSLILGGNILRLLSR
ncbi:amidohydrolase family protein [Chloroflexota bacterium]